MSELLRMDPREIIGLATRMLEADAAGVFDNPAAKKALVRDIGGKLGKTPEECEMLTVEDLTSIINDMTAAVLANR